MGNVFEVVDSTSRKIRLTEEQWLHIKQDHPDITMEEIELTLTKPLKIVDKEGDKAYYYHYFKSRKSAFKYVRSIIKYLNGHGFVITAYPVRNLN